MVGPPPHPPPQGVAGEGVAPCRARDRGTPCCLVRVPGTSCPVRIHLRRYAVPSPLPHCPAVSAAIGAIGVFHTLHCTQYHRVPLAPHHHRSTRPCAPEGTHSLPATGETAGPSRRGHELRPFVSPERPALSYESVSVFSDPIPVGRLPYGEPTGPSALRAFESSSRAEASTRLHSRSRRARLSRPSCVLRDSLASSFSGSIVNR